MFIDFKDLSEDSKVWIYPSNRKFYPQEIEEVQTKIQLFIDDWNSNDANFKASYQFLYNRFIIFSVDENSSIENKDIDTSVQFILELEKEYNVQLLDRMNVCFKQGEFVQYKDLKEFKKLIKSRAISKKTIVFDNLVTTKQELENYWEVPITESWYNRFL